ncbi:DNA-directed RNA polymerase I subunit RPA34 Ecym_5185 [Eremothecium cymbalariae DBVPG|uniref:DNA-directed RNA polymerase I subunit RPA34 n=1 Tax=Eremothecium cymbalariae (strain CBS 270.75 / DBVPG 7215 / KCTC 17166 / NRRL Y-17582) TaxID=931890 RepID=I6ND15_ERECY|nr:hypothetical protein Ecym_5185 [Eremothecium cymbalariae DBVPG\
MTKLSKESVSNLSDEEQEVKDVFQIPRGYKQCQHLNKFNKPSKADKKEVWLLKVPKSLDISKLKTLPIDFTGDAPSELSLGDRKYLLREDLLQEDQQAQDSKGNKFSIMVPNNEDNLTVDCKLSIAKFFNVSEAVDIPAIQYDQIRTPRQDVLKVTGLKMRHFATGYNAEDFDIDEEKRLSDGEPPTKKYKKSHEGKKEKKEKKEKKHKEKKEKKDKRDKKDDKAKKEKRTKH